MRVFALSLLLLSFTKLLSGAELTLPLTAQTVENWSLSGARLPEIGRDPLSLPANTQLYRGFSADRVAVELVSRPVFAAMPDDWMVIELGSAALVFAREENRGALVLMVGDDAPEVHRVPGELNAEGRHADPIRIVIGRNEHGVELEIAGIKVERRAPAERDVRVVFSTGSGAGMELDRAAVVLTVIDGSHSEALVEEAASASKALARENAENDLESTPARVVGAAGGSDTPKKGGSPLSAITVYRPLEIATPPSVRGHRSERVEAAVKALSNK